MPKNKPKLKGVTFQLVHRSQQDPLIVDETAPQRVLLPILEKQSKSKKTTDNDEHEKYGVYFDEDYEYLKHLKDVKDNHMEWPEHVEEELKQREKENAAKKLQLASSVFASEVQEDVGMLNKAAPISGLQLNLDPDIVAAMDDDFDYDDPQNQLEDNFFDLADGIASDEELERIDEEMEDQFESLDSDGSERSFTKQETKSRFTNYSMTSSVIRRNEQLQLLDNRFEKMYEQYDDSEIGVVESAEDCEENPAIFEDLLKKYAEEFAEDQKLQKLDKGNDPVLNKTKELSEFTHNDEENTESENSDDEEMEKWDCQTILSTYSNTQNLPKLIELPNLKKKIQLTKLGIPKNTLNNANKLTINALNQLNQQNSCLISSNGPKSMAQSSIVSQLSALSIRAKNETVEERKKRKLFLKEFRRERRREKKENSVAFKELKKQENKIILNNRNNIQGNKIL